MNNMPTQLPTVSLQVWDNKRVVSYDDIARLHKVSKNRVIKAFQRHSEELLKGEDYYDLTRQEMLEFKENNALDNLSISNQSTGMRVFTESGYLVLACTFRGAEAAYVRRQLVNSYFKVKELRAAQPTGVSSQLLISLEETIINQNKMLAAINESLDRLFNKPGEETKAIAAPQEESIPQNPPELQDGEATTTFLAERCRWYSTQGKPHTAFTEHVLRTLGVHTNKCYEYNDPYSRCVIQEVDGKIVPSLYIKPAGIQKLLDWCRKTDYARSIRKVERYQRDFGIHKAGDVKSVYYLLETDGVKGVCRADKKRYNLKDF